MLQISDPEKRKDFDSTPEYKEAAKRLTELVRDNRFEIEAQRSQLQNAGERRYWRLEQWRSIGPHDSELSSHLNLILHEMKTLEVELGEWLKRWNELVTNVAIDAAEPLISGTASRISVINQIHDNLVQLRRDEFPTSSKLVSLIEIKSSEFTEYVDQNLLRKPKNSRRNWWR
jgi:hypothetical protein